MGATIKDIAARTGLGLATISKYLNGGHVLEKNRIAIERAIAELNFQVNPFARSLKTNQSRTIGVIIPQLDNLFMTSIVASMEELLRKEGYGVLVCDTGKQEQREEEALHFLVNKMVDGIILLTTTKEGQALDFLLERRLPIVLIDRRIERLDGRVDMVLVDNFQAAFQSTRYFLERGHREIAIFLGSNDIYVSEQRLRGYQEAMRQAGLSVREAYIRRTDFSMDMAYEETVSLLHQAPQVTAIFATNFEMTLGVLLALNDRNIPVPEQISLIGYDNRDLARAMRPRLTIVTQPMRRIGEHAASLILQRIQEQQSQKLPQSYQQVMLQARIEEGATVAEKGAGQQVETEK